MLLYACVPMEQQGSRPPEGMQRQTGTTLGRGFMHSCNTAACKQQLTHSSFLLTCDGMQAGAL